VLRLLPLLLSLSPLACAIPAAIIRSHYDLPKFTHDVGGWREEMLPMRDGVKLMTRIVMPAGVDKAPVVLVRNPYNLLPAALKLQCDVYARYGLGCVIQDVRGRLDSEGKWEPLIHEGDDGTDTLNWLQAQPWVESIALTGGSYLAATALSPGNHYPPKVKTLVVMVFGVSLHPVVHERGLFPHELLTAWAAYMPGREPTLDGTQAYRGLLASRPHYTADEAVLGKKLEFYRAWLRSQSPDDPLWTGEQTRNFESVPTNIHVPVLYIEGLDDPFLAAGLDTFSRLGSRDQSTMLILPMNHTGGQSGDIKSDVDTLAIYTWTYSVPWLLHQLQGAPLPFEKGVVKSWAHADPSGPHVRKDWPGATQAQTFFLDSHLAGDAPCPQHGLTRTPPSTATLEYEYDPAHPWLSEGGARGLAYIIASGVRPGPVRQSWECRDDVVRFIGPATDAPQRLIGRMKLEADVRSSAYDTAFVAKLVDIDESGNALHVTDGAATLQWPTAQTREALPYHPLETRRVEIDFFPTEWVLQKGHHLGLWLSSSSYPMFSLHLNTDTPWYDSVVYHVADQQVLIGPSQLTLQTGD
jgi:putative CocE/NonD family hydrolase